MKEKIIYDNKKMSCEDSSAPKACFCIGPENCNDDSCRLVKEYRERENNRRGPKFSITAPHVWR
jgi:hypothetical protein